jgi:dTDP-glucose 4,6-dehydratase
MVPKEGSARRHRFFVVGKPQIRHLLVAGGAGFLGSAFVRDRLRADQEIQVTALDALRRPGAQADLVDLAEDKRFRLVKGDVRDRALVEDVASASDAVVNFVSEEFMAGAPSDGPAFARTDIEGTAVLLEAARKFRHHRFLLVSSADIYGPVKAKPNREEDPVEPGTISLAARVAAETMTRAYAVVHRVPTLITRGVASYGPRQPMDQAVAQMIASALRDLQVLVEGDGSTERDYLHVDDQVGAIARVLWKGDPGGTYNIGAGNQVTGNQLADTILQLCGKPSSMKRSMKTGSRGSFAVDTRRMRQLGWEMRFTLAEGLRTTVDWYRRNESWWRERQAA